MTPAGDVNAGAETNNAQVKQRRISEEGIQEYLFIPRTAQSVGTDNLPLHGKEPIACPSVPAGVSSSAGVRPNNGDASLHHVELPQQLPSLSRYIYPQLHCSPAELNWISSDSATDDLGCYPINHIHRPFAWARACIIAALSLAGVVATLCVIGSANSESPLSAAIVVIFVLHQVTLTAFGVLLAEVTNESTVSGMVAQRYDKISYLTILVLVSYSWWTASYILCGGSARASAGGISGTSAEAVRVFVAAASPIVMLGVFLFPIVVVKNARELSMIPLDSLACVTLPPEGTARAPRASDFQQHSHFRVAFWHGMSRRWHSFMHFFCFGTGASAGLATVVWHLHVYWLDMTPMQQGVETALLCVSTLCFLVFTAAMFMPSMSDSHPGRRRIFLVEFLGCHYFMLSLILSNVIAEKFVGVAAP